MSSPKQVTIRFSRWMGEPQEAFKFFSFVISPLINKELVLVTDSSKKVDIEISSVYGEPGPTDLSSKIQRYIHSKTPGGVPFGGWARGFNLQPSNKAKVNIFYTGENERPPYGEWDAYLSFDTQSFGGKNAYLPLWWFTCTDLAGETNAPYLGAPIPISEMLNRRKVNYDSRNKFCVAFIGKAYPFRMQALAALSVKEKVEVYGAIARKDVKSKMEASAKYKFVFAFENDLYPGYVTEKAIEAWATGAIPLYWGSDPESYLNPKAIINLASFASLEEFAAYVNEVASKKEIWEEIASEPILLRAPDLTNVNVVLSRALDVLK